MNAGIIRSRIKYGSTTASLFDGHDAAINIMRRLIQDLVQKLFTWVTTVL